MPRKADSQPSSSPSNIRASRDHSTAHSSSGLKVLHSGKVYRPLSSSSPKAALKMYDASGLLGEPDETVSDAEREEKPRARKRQRLLTPSPLSEDEDLIIDGPVKSHTDPHSKAWRPPTPPPSQHRPQPQQLNASSFNLQAVLSKCEDPLDVALPKIYEAVVAQHSALERGLVLHLATEGGRAAGLITSTSTDANGTLRAQLPNMFAYSAVQKMVELGSKKRLGAEELARLRWVWNLEPPLGYTVTTMRELDHSGKKAQTWGLGIELEVLHRAPQPTLELLSGLPPSPRQRIPSRTGSRDSMSIVALWTQGSEARIQEVRRRLGAFVLWQLDAGAEGQRPMPVPRAELPALRDRLLNFSASPTKTNADAQGLLEGAINLAAVKPAGTLASRASTQLERIKAKQAAKLKGSTQASIRGALGEKEVLRIETPMERMETLRERSALSRLAAIADGVHLLFSTSALPMAPASPTMSVPTPPTRKRRAVPLDDCCALIAKSSRTALSEAEAREALEILTRVSPGYITIREIDRRLWVAHDGEVGLREVKLAIKEALNAQ